MKSWWWVSVHLNASFLIFKVLPCQRPRYLKQLQQQLLAFSFNASRVQKETGKWYSDLCTANNLIYNQRCSHWQWIAEAATAVHCNYCVHMTLFAVLYFMADGENLLFLFCVVHILSSFNSHLWQLGKWPVGLRLSFLLPEYDILSSEQPLDISNGWITSF